MNALRRLDVEHMVLHSPPPIPWVVEGLVVRGALTVLNGKEGEGKSLMSLSFAAGVLSGHTVAGMQTANGGVLVVDAENGEREIHRRVQALGVNLIALPVVYEAQGYDLRDLEPLEAILSEEDPALLILDSFRSLWRGEENDSKETAAVLDPLRDLVRAHDVGCLLLHHSGKNGETYRGSSAIGASAELGFTLAHKTDDPDPARRVLKCWKARPCEKPSQRWLRMAVERGQVYIDEADAPVDAQAPAVVSPARAEFRPRVLAAMNGQPLSASQIAFSLTGDKKHSTTHRVIRELANEGRITHVQGAGWLKVQEGVSASTTPIGPDTPDTPPTIPHSNGANGGVTGPDTPDLFATPSEEAEAERLRLKFGGVM